MSNRDQVSDSVLYAHKEFDGTRRQEGWLYKAYSAFNRLSQMRKRRKRSRDFETGRHYEDVVNFNGRQMTKEEYMRQQGLPPIQLNMIGKMSRSVRGQFRQSGTTPICSAPDPNEKKYADFYSQLLIQNMKLNRRHEMDAVEFHEYLISGWPIARVCFAHRDGKDEVWQDYIHPCLAFWPHSLDPYLRDIRFCGMLHDLDFSEILEHFSKSEEDDAKLTQIYTHCMDDEYIQSMYGAELRTSDISYVDFFHAQDYSKCRVIELWTKERRPAYMVHDPLEPNDYYVPYTKAEKRALDEENKRRMDSNIMKDEDGVTPMTDENGQIMYFEDPERFEKENKITYKRKIEAYWYYRYLSPDGYVLEEGESPYWNGGESLHPFVFHPMDYIDGQEHSFVSNVIPAQEYFNYYIVALDFYIRNAAKGVLMVDEESLSPDMTIDEIAEQYVRTNGVILYTSKKNGQKPHTETSSTIPGGFEFFIRLSQSMTEDISGVAPAMQGKRENAATSGVQYEAMRSQAATTILDMLEGYSAFLEEIARKTIKIMQCCYTGTHTVAIAGEEMSLNLDTMGDVDLDISITFAPDAPTYRMLTNAFLMDMAAKGQLPIEAVIEAGDFQNGPKIMHLVEKYKQIQQQQQIQAAQQQVAAPTV